MMEQRIKEMAELYGIEIEEVEPGQGGLFYVDAEGEKIMLSDVSVEE